MKQNLGRHHCGNTKKVGRQSFADNQPLRINLWFLFAALACHPVSALQITDVRASRTAFDPTQAETTEIRFQIDEPATVAFRLYDGRELLIHQIVSELPSGEHAFTWDGTDASGHIVPPEAYHYTLHAATASGEETTFDLTDLTGGERVAAQDIVWNGEAEVIRYRLPRPARIAVRVGLKNHGPLLRTLVDWVPRPGGINEEAWDGWDTSRVMELTDHPKLNLFIDAYALSDNTLLVGTPPRQSEFVALDERTERNRTPPTQKRMYYHAQQPLETRGDIAISLNLPEDLPQDDDGIPILTGRVPVRLEVAPEDRQRAIERRFEPVFFVDGVFAFENEVGYLPFTWIWDTATTNPGIHYVTANLRGYEGNFGIATLKVRVPPQQSGEQP